ncbi:MAG: hypothetical protein JNL98_09725 [Bryobacterales bacterium]|nr:hypothetical protein [Bryobacterales bacterium]
MKGFHFRLQRVLAWYQTKAKIEELQLQKLHAERDQLLKEIAAIGRSWNLARAGTVGSTEIRGTDLRSLAAYQIHMKNEITRLQSLLLGCSNRIAAQLQNVTAARRQVEMIDRLRLRRKSEWTREQSKEEEALATENFLARHIAVMEAELADCISMENG